MYYLKTGQYDSAGHFFRKELNAGQDYNNQNAAARGLSFLYSQTSRPDSAAKYALYSYDMLDSVYAQMSTKEVERTKAVFNYSRQQAIAVAEKEKADSERGKVVVLSALIIILIVLAACIYIVRRRQRLEARSRYEAKKAELRDVLSELEVIRSEEEEHKRKIHVLEERIRQREEKERLVREQDIKEGELLEQMLKEREDETSRLREELDYLRAKEERLDEQRRDHSARASLLDTYFSVDTQKENTLLAEAEAKLNESGVYVRIKAKSAKSQALSEQDINYLETVIRDVLPQFHQTLFSQRYHLSRTEAVVCILLRLHYPTKQVAALLGVTPSSISQCRDTVLMKLFNEHGASKVLREKVGKMAK